MSRPATHIAQIRTALRTAFKGMRLTGSHYRRGKDFQKPLAIDNPEYFKQAPGPVTVPYPSVKVPIPDIGRYRLHMETDDCIGCDKCARICPVDCITIETFRADGDLGKTSDGTLKRLHLPVFDIDMAKCMFCGLCTTVCPTECLTMTKVYDFSEYDRDNFTYHFGAYSPEEEMRVRRETDEALEKKKALKENAASVEGKEPEARKPMMKRPVVQQADTPATELKKEESAENTPVVRPRPMMKRVQSEQSPQEEEKKEDVSETPAVRPRPVFKRSNPVEQGESEVSRPEEKPQQEESQPEEPKSPRPRPVFKRSNPVEQGESEVSSREEKPQQESQPEEPKSPRPRPVFKRSNPVEQGESEVSRPEEKPQQEESQPEEPKSPRPRPVFKRSNPQPPAES